jgi:hypothetical protein
VAIEKMGINMNIAKTRTILLSLIFVLTAAFSTSCKNDENNLTIPGVTGPTLTLLDDTILITMVLQNVQLEGGLRYSIPEYENSYIEVGPDLESTGTLMAISVKIADIFGDNLLFLPPQELPGGRPLPGVASGRLPAVAFTLDFLGGETTFYLGPKFFGIFIPVPMDIGVNNIVTARFYSNKIRAGNLSIVGPDETGENSGFLLLLDLSQSVKKMLRKRM